ncbi:MAG: zinc ribbon domain-containing protein [Thermoplasmata archaeon]
MSTPAVPAPPASAVCSQCQAPLPSGVRFCPQCGAPATGGSSGAGPWAAATGPVDLRERIDQDRGSLKRLQLLVPGFRGYRQGEDIREADSFLRIQVANRLANGIQTIQNVRSALTQAGQFAALTDLAPLLADLQMLEGSVRHAEQGYSGISAPVRVGTAQLDRLYEYDYGFVQAADQLNGTLSQLPASAASGGANSRALIATARGQVAQLSQAFQARLKAIEGLRV